MIANEDFLNTLRGLFSLNLYEVRIWTALLSRGVASAGELSDIGNVPRSRAYDVLESLEKKGFVMMKLGKPIKYIAVEPKEVIDRVKKNFVRDAQDRSRKLDDVKSTDLLEELNVLHKQGIEFVEPSDLSGAVRGRHNIFSHMESMVKKAQKSVIITTTAKGFLRKIEALKPELERLKKKGVKIRIATPITKDNSHLVKDVGKFAELRHSDKLNARFCIVDGKDMMFMPLDDEDVHPTYDVGVWVTTPYFASAMERMFDMHWEGLPKAG